MYLCKISNKNVVHRRERERREGVEEERRVEEGREKKKYSKDITVKQFL
jgi:hypothetical protein